MRTFIKYFLFTSIIAFLVVHNAKTINGEPVCDEFNGTSINSALWNAYSGTWTQSDGRITGYWSLSDAYGEQGNLILSESMQPTGDYTFETDMINTPASGQGSPRIILYNSAGNKYSIAFESWSRGVTTELKQNGGIYQSLNALGYYKADIEVFTSGAGIVNRAKVVKHDGNQFTVYINDLELFTIVESVWNGNVRIGLGAYGSSMFENACITVNDQPSDDLIAFWPMDEESGSVITDASGNNLHGTATGATIIDGKVNKARAFFGNEYIEVPDNDLLDLDDEITIMMWVKLNTSDAEGILISKRLYDDIDCKINYDIKYGFGGGHNFITFQFGTGCTTGNNYLLQDVALLNDGDWHHIAISMQFGNPPSALWMIDGQEYPGTWSRWDGTPGGGDDIPPINSNSLQLGRQLSSSPGYCVSDIDQVRLYNRMLNTNEIITVYTSENNQSQQNEPDIYIAQENLYHDYSEVQSGESAQWTFIIQNVGLEILEINGISLSNPVFAVVYPVSYPWYIGTSMDDTVVVAFSPTELVEYSGELLISCNDPDEEEITIQLSGKGIPPQTTAIRVPTDYPTIQAAIDAALPNDTILVEPGTYTGAGNRDIEFRGKSIVLKSTNGPSATIIDCQGSSTDNHRGFIFQSGETSASHLEGFFITNGYASNGAAIYCDQTSPTIVNCIIRYNSGDGIYSFAGSPVISGCRIEHCSGSGFRGQFASPTIQNSEFHFNSTILLERLERATITGCVLSHSSSLLLYNESQYRQPFVNIGYCTFADNSGYGIISDGCITQIYRSIIAFNTGQSIYCGAGSVNISESDVFGNSGGNWVDCIADQKYQGNLEVDPLFCNRATADYHLLESSPCSGIGALSVGCMPRLWHIYADGSGDVPTIQEAVTAASPGDTILLHPGTYTGAGNRDIELTGKHIVLKSMSGPDNTILDCQGNQNDNHRALNIHDGVSSQCLIEGITFQKGYLKSGISWEGGASILCRNASPTIRNCIFRNNTVEGTLDYGGGAMAIVNSTLSISFCVFEKNVAPHTLGGALSATSTTLNIQNCTFINNLAFFGDAIGLWGTSNVSINNCILAYNGTEYYYGDEPGAIFCMNSPTPTLNCCNIFGNANGDWIGCIASQVSEAGNMSENPLFCSVANHDFHLMDLSSCTPARNTCQELIGCLPVGCQTPVPGLISPGPNADILTTESILFQWSQVSWTESYTIEISLDPTTSNQAIEDRPAGTFISPLIVIDAGNANQWLAEAGYLSIGKYYWHVLARYGAAGGTFSSTRTFTVKWPLSVSNWTVFCKDSLRTAATVEEVRPPYRMTWGGTPIATGSPVRAPAVVSGDTLFFADCGGKVWALNVETGGIFWSVSLSSTVQFWASPLYQNGRLYVTGSYPSQSAGIVYCLNARNGSTIWTRNFNGGSLMNAPTLVAGQLLVYENQTTHVLSAGDGTYIRAFAGGLWSPAAVWRNKAYFNYSQLYEYDPSTGQVTALLETGQSSPVGISPDGHIYFNNHSMLSSFNLQTQQLDWTSNQNYTGGVLPRQLAVGENLVIVPSGSAIYAVNRETGQYVWTAYGSQGGSMDTQSPIIAGNTVLFTKGYGCLYAVDLTTGGELTYYQPATTYCYSSPIVSHGRIFYGLDNGNFYGLETGQETRATLTIFCFNDANGDGLKGAYEQPLPNLTVQLSNGMTGTTGLGGLCGFTVDAPVIYTVTVSTPTGYVNTTPNPATIRAEIGGYNQVFMGFQTKPTLTISPATFGPLTKENPAVTFTVQLTGKGTPLVGRQVEILSYIAPTGTPGLMTTVTTDANGQGTYTWSIEHVMESPGYNVNFIARFNGDSEWGPAIDTSFGSITPFGLTVTLDSPSNGATITLPYTFQWHASYQTEVNYTLQFAQNGAFTTPVYFQQITTMGPDVSLEIPDGSLLANQTYQWRVVAEREGKDPVISQIRSVQVQAIVGTLPPPELVSPQDGEIVTPQPTFIWTLVPNAHLYKLEISGSPDFSQIVVYRQIAGTATSLTLSEQEQLISANTYYWRMATHDGIAWGVHSSVRVLIGDLSQDEPRIYIIDENMSHDFGEQSVGLPASWTLHIQNIGNADLIISSFEFSDVGMAAYTVDSPNPPINISPSSDISISVIFTPITSDIDYPADFIIHSNDPVNKEIIIPLTGRGKFESQETELVFGAVHIKGMLIYENDDGKKVVKGNITINDFLHIGDSLIVDINTLTVIEVGQIYIEYLGQQLILYEGESEFGILGPEGKLTNFINKNVLRQLHLAGIKVTLKDLELLSDGVRIAGRLDMKLPQMSKPIVISITNLSVSQSSGIQVAGQVNVPTIDLLGAIQLTDTQLNFDTEEDYFSGFTRAKTPLVAIGGGATIKQGQLDRVKLTIELGHPVPIGSTGIFLSGGAGELDQLTTPNIVITLTVDLTGGPSVGGTYIVELKEFGLSVSPPDYLAGMGKLKVFGQNVASGQIYYNKGVIGAKGRLSLIDVLKAELTASLEGSRFEGSATGDISIPDGTGFPYDLIKNVVELPYEIAGSTLFVTNERISGEVTLTREFEVLGQTIKLELNLATALVYEPPNVAFYLGTDMEHLTQIVVTPIVMFASTNSNQLPLTMDNHESIYITTGSNQVIFRIEGNYSAPECSISGPNSYNVKSSETDSALLNGAFFFTNDVEHVTYCIVQNPTPGHWRVEPSETENQTCTIDVYVPNVSPVVLIENTELESTINMTGGIIPIYYHVIDSDDDLLAELFYDTDNQGADGALITSNLEPSINGNYSWNVSNIPTGSYYVYIKVSDGKNAPVISYANQPFHIVCDDAPTAPINLEGYISEDTLYLHWSKSSSQNVLGYVINYSDDEHRPLIEQEITVSDTSCCTITGLKAGRVYRFFVSAFDTLGHMSTRSESITINLESTSFGNYPVIISEPVRRVKAMTDYEYLIVAEDRDGDLLTISLLESPMGMFLLNNIVTWPSTVTVPGKYAVGIAVVDGTGHADSQYYELEVYRYELGDGECMFNQTKYVGNNIAAFLTLHDLDLDKDNRSSEEVFVNVYSDADMDGFTLSLTETGANTGVFNGYILLNEISSDAANLQLKVSHGASIYALYNDLSPFGEKLATAMWFRGTYGSVVGNVHQEGNAAIGVPLDIYDSLGNLWQSVVTDDSGYYYIDSIPNGDYTISVVTPLGYQADQETKEFTIHHVPVTVNFNLTPLGIKPKPRTRAYWAHQLQKALQNKPQDYNLTKFSQFTGLIDQHFNQNLLNPVDFYTVLQPATQQDSLNVLRQLLHMVPCDDNEPFLKKLGKAQLMALMLNVVSGKIHQMQVISTDSLTVSQAITYCDMLINDEITPDDDGGPGCGSPWIRYIRADFILTFINLGLKVPAGLIPPDIINIAYRYRQQTEPTVPETFTLYQNYPNPFNPYTEIGFDLPHSTDVKLEIYNIMGQKVATLVDQSLSAGHHSFQWDASNQASGVYFYKITTGDIVETKKMVLLK